MHTVLTPVHNLYLGRSSHHLIVHLLHACTKSTPKPGFHISYGVPVSPTRHCTHSSCLYRKHIYSLNVNLKLQGNVIFNFAALHTSTSTHCSAPQRHLQLYNVNFIRLHHDVTGCNFTSPTFFEFDVKLARFVHFGVSFSLFISLRINS